MTNVINISFMTCIFEIVQSLAEILYLIMEFNGLKVEELRIKWADILSISCNADKDKPWNMTVLSIIVFLLANAIVLFGVYLIDVYYIKFVSWPSHLNIDNQ